MIMASTNLTTNSSLYGCLGDNEFPPLPHKPPRVDGGGGGN